MKRTTLLALSLMILGACDEAVMVVGEVTVTRGNPAPAPPPQPTPPPPQPSPPPPRPSLDAGGSPDVQPPADPPFDCYDPPAASLAVLNNRCGVCHAVNMPANGLDLVSPGLRDRLLVMRSPSCQGKPMVTFDNGYVGGHLFDKLAGSIPGCGNMMPFGGIRPLQPAAIECLKVWLRGP